MDLDYASLRAEAIGHLERMSGKQWTDFNVHDPGITLLELVCYVLTDLDYRTGFAVPDLLASGAGDAFENLYRPSEILSCRPVTLVDQLSLIVDVDGVQNAWIEPDRSGLPFHYRPERRELSHLDATTASDPVELDGLYRVLIEPSELAVLDGTTVEAAVARRLYGNRGLCQDFTTIEALNPQGIRVQAGIEIGMAEDAEAVLVDILEAIANKLSPRVPFLKLGQMLEKGYTVDEIFEGPLLDHGFIEPGVLEQVERRSRLNASDLIQVIMDVPGVRAIQRISMSAGDESPEPWSLKLERDRPPRLDVEGSRIDIERAGIAARINPARVRKAYEARRRQSAGETPSLGLMTDEAALIPPGGRDRAVGRYRSAQRDLPALYGIGELGLPASATAERQARARQLRAYMMFFDQLLANEFAQLANVGRLFSFGGEDLRTYFSQVIDEPELEDIAVRDPAGRRARLAEITEDVGPRSEAAGAVALERKDRFLDHLLARFSEAFADYSFVPFDTAARADSSQIEKRIRDKQAFLSHYPRVSAGRGTARNDLAAVDRAEPSALEDRIRLKLGLDADEGESLLLVEHILLRPMEDDDAQTVPLLAAARSPDPYSLQLSVVFPGDRGRFSIDGNEDTRSFGIAFRSFAEWTVREETPAHLTAYVHWLSSQDWTRLEQAYRDWLDRRRDYLSVRSGLAVSGSGA